MPSSLERKLTEVNEARALSINNCQIKIQQHVHLLLLYKVETHPISYSEAPKIVFLSFFPPIPSNIIPLYIAFVSFWTCSQHLSINLSVSRSISFTNY